MLNWVCLTLTPNKRCLLKALLKYVLCLHNIIFDFKRLVWLCFIIAALLQYVLLLPKIILVLWKACLCMSYTCLKQFSTCERLAWECYTLAWNNFRLVKGMPMYVIHLFETIFDLWKACICMSYTCLIQFSTWERLA